MLQSQRTGRRSAVLGVVALLTYVIHEGIYVYRGEPANGLWTCDMALLGVGFGLLIPSPIANAVGAFWLTAGFPLWIYYLFVGGDVVTTTLLVHVGGLVMGYAGIRRLGLPRFTWLVSIVALFLLILLSRPFSSPAENINLSYGVYAGAERLFTSYWTFMLATGALFLGVFATIQWSLPKFRFFQVVNQTHVLPDRD